MVISTDVEEVYINKKWDNIQKCNEIDIVLCHEIGVCFGWV